LQWPGGASTGHGSIGWLSAAPLDEPDLPAWVLTSMHSNPFASATCDGSSLLAQTTNEYTWRVDIADPSEVTISRD